MKDLGIKEIKKIIPHRYPMLLLDRVVEVIPGKSATGIHNVSFNEEVVQASSKTNPVLPAPLIVEALAQTGAVALLSEEKFSGKTAYFGGIQQADFFDEAQPGDQLILKTELTKIRKNIGVGIGKAYVKEKLIVSAELTFVIN
ncbi:3-hydroxyacyl-ACP dehydratase FabZ [Lactobacillus sp. PV012]|uniref:3-hydroxyacyl-ACP dehydratase FabZ n=1 Tax=Lactobacillus sp. PV012 TaxID=2594494 RepID=UPI00223FB738|nr:3-hydroxyacyl-ACP dehydratase FabZ [Lactobacillus sp. PV012]QNQ82030.1 beta-hydroxyacyl-ACP dehydratase [Lactobacillus sp. PV012]